MLYQLILLYYIASDVTW